MVEGIDCLVVFSEIEWAVWWQGDSRKIIKGINGQAILGLNEVLDSVFQLFDLDPSLGVHIRKKDLGRGVDHLRSKILSHETGLQGLHDFSQRGYLGRQHLECVGSRVFLGWPILRNRLSRLYKGLRRVRWLGLTR